MKIISLAQQITYRKLIAGVILVVYAFIATPTQFWHHHSTNSDNETSKRETQDKSLAKGSSPVTGEDCFVCSHKYSAYNNAAIIPFVASLSFFVVTDAGYFDNFLSSPSSSLSNKGPPQLI